MNNHDPLELTLRSLVAHTNYPNYRILVADNGSSDASGEVLDWAESALPLSVMREQRLQSDWYDWAASDLDTDLWVGLHDDVVFLGRDWLADLVVRMQSEPDLQLLGGQAVAPQYGVTEPADGNVIDIGESLSTWLFCARRGLGRRLPTSSFAFSVEQGDEQSRPFCYEMGGRLMADMAQHNLPFGCMPREYQRKWHHIGNLSWFADVGTDDHKVLKRLQLREVRRRVMRQRRSPVASARE
jgi:hypothetical protein